MQSTQQKLKQAANEEDGHVAADKKGPIKSLKRPVYNGDGKLFDFTCQGDYWRVAPELVSSGLLF